MSTKSSVWPASNREHKFYPRCMKTISLTLRRPRPVSRRSLLRNLKPHATRGLPRVDILPVGDARHVEQHGADVSDGSLGGEADGRAGGDGLHGGRRAAGLLVAAHERVVDVGQALARPLVGGPPDEFPFPAHVAIGDEGREDVWGALGIGIGVRGSELDLLWAEATVTAARSARETFILTSCSVYVLAVACKLGERSWSTSILYICLPAPVSACIGRSKQERCYQTAHLHR